MHCNDGDGVTEQQKYLYLFKAAEAKGDAVKWDI